MDNESQTGYLGAFGSGGGSSLAARVEAARQQTVQRTRTSAAGAQWAELTADYAALAGRIDSLDDPNSTEVDALHDVLAMAIRRLDRRPTL
jgi:hypothetical protein